MVTGGTNLVGALQRIDACPKPGFVDLEHSAILPT